MERIRRIGALDHAPADTDWNDLTSGDFYSQVELDPETGGPVALPDGLPLRALVVDNTDGAGRVYLRFCARVGAADPTDHVLSVPAGMWRAFDVDALGASDGSDVTTISVAVANAADEPRLEWRA
jgi:hypothetical protein